MAPTGEQTRVDGISGEISAGAGDVIGRRAQLERLADAVAAEKLVQIVGPPGVGKSRLMEAWLEESEAGRAFTETPIVCEGRPAPEQVVGAIAAAGSDQERRSGVASPDVQRLADRLEGAEATLLALDLPHGMQSGPRFFEQLADRAPSVTVVLATQERQRVMSPTDLVHLEGLPTSPAVELLRRRVAVTAGSPGEFGDREEFERLVEGLDGLPLAIEAAADLSHVMTAREILERWREEPTWLFGEADHGARRQFRERLERAWAALTDDEQAALRRLSVATAPFPVELLESVQPEDAGRAPLELLEGLVGKSWLSRTTRSGRAEFELAPVFRRFAARRLADDERIAVVRRVAEYACDQLDQWSDELEAGPAAGACERVRSRERIFRQTAASVAESSPSAALRLLVGLGRFHAVLAETEAVVETLASVLDRSTAGRVDSQLRARAMATLAELAQRTGRSDIAREWAGRAVELAGEIDAASMARALLASSLTLVGVDLEAAVQRLEEAREYAEAAAPALRARIGIRLGYCALRDFELEEARHRFENARRALADLAEPMLRSELASGLGYVSFRMNRADAAVAAFEEVVDQEQMIGTADRLADAHFNLGNVALEIGRASRARRELEKAHDLWSDEDRMQMVVLALVRTGALFAEDGAYERARSVLRRALRLTDRFADAHNRAVAEGILALVAMLEDREEPPVDVFRDALQGLVVWREPATAAVFRVAVDLRPFFASGAAGEESDGLPVSLRGLLSLIGPHDHRLERVVTRLARLRIEVFERLAPERVEPEWREVVGGGEVSADGGRRDREAAVGELPCVTARLLGEAVDDRLGTAEQRHDYGPPPEEAAHRLVVHPDGHWFRVDEAAPVDLMSRQPLRRVLGAIVRQTVDPAADGATVDELIEVGWPDQTPTRESGRNRVYNVIRMLRDKGLEEVIATGEAGYVLDPSVSVFLEETAAPEAGADDL